MPKPAGVAYTDLLVRIDPWSAAQGFYPVEAWINHAGHTRGGALRLDFAALLAESDRTAYGLTLFYALFSGPIRAAYDQALGYAAAHTQGRLRVRLWIAPEAPELHALCWEALHSRVGGPEAGTVAPLAVAAERPFARYLSPETPAAVEPVSGRRLRLLVAIANPSDLEAFELAPLNAEVELTSLLSVLQGVGLPVEAELLIAPGQISPEARAAWRAAGHALDESGHVSLEALLRRLNTDAGFDILHVLSHGAVRRRDSTAVLYLEAADGTVGLATDEAIAVGMRSLAHKPVLVFLAACESALRAEGPAASNAFSGLAPKLVDAGIAAVIAMQDRVPILSAQAFAREFYRYFLSHGTADLAMSQARLDRYEARDSAWITPVIYMSVADGQLVAADRLLSALNLMVGADAYNPLGVDGRYMPSMVAHVLGNRVPPELVRGEQRAVPVRETLSAVLGTLGDGAEARAPRQRAEHGIVALVGEPGMGKSVQLRRIAKAVAGRSLSEDDMGQRIVPVLLDAAAPGEARALEEIGGWVAAIEATLRPYWPDLDSSELQRLLAASKAPRFWLFVDGSDTLSDGERYRVWGGLLRFWRRYPRQACLVAYDLPLEDLEALPFTDCFLLQPTPQRELKRYLLDLSPVGEALYGALRRVQLCDLAALPWVLARLLEEAERDQFPTSMRQVVRDLLIDSVETMSLEWGVRREAERSLYALAWQMQNSGRSLLALDEVFATLIAVRGNRGYSVETLFRHLIEQGLLTMVGADLVRFTRSIIRSYCAAQLLLEAESLEEQVDSITATLGRRTRMAWWEATLILLADELTDPTWLVRAILYGIEVGEGEQIFLCARILQEVGLRRVDAKLRAYMVSALCNRLDSAREARVWRRERIAEALGQIGHVDALPYLVRAAGAPVRTSDDGTPVYEAESVRLAASLALQRLTTAPFADVERLDAALAAVLRAWYARDLETLAVLFAEGGGSAAVAAYALGDLGTEVASDILIRAFFYPGGSEAERLTLSTALTLLDVEEVTRRVLQPIFDPGMAAHAGPGVELQADRERLLNHTIYVAGKIGSLDESVRAALRSCVTDCTELERKGLAVTALGALYDASQKQRFEAIAAGEFKGIRLPADPAAAQLADLRRRALEALRTVGDVATLARFRSRPDDWSPELETALYEVSEAILGRESVA